MIYHFNQNVIFYCKFLVFLVILFAFQLKFVKVDEKKFQFHRKSHRILFFSDDEKERKKI